MDRKHLEVDNLLAEAAHLVRREKEATGNAEPPEGYKRGQILFLYLTSIKAGRMKFSPVMEILYSN